MKYCPKCGTELKKDANFCADCGARIKKLDMKMAEVGARFGSFVLDQIILFVIGFVIGLIFGDIFGDEIMFSLALLATAAYFTYFFGNGQTPGMTMAKIKLCRTDGTYPIGYGRGFLRWIGMIISSVAIYLGFLWILVDKNKQGWHDKIADTYVIVE